MTAAESGRPRSFCKNCGKKIVGFHATISAGTAKYEVSVWFDPDADSPHCPTGGDHEPTQHPTVAESE